MIDHVVVLGAGISGLATAAVVAEHAHAVTVVDRDRFADEAMPRPGAPQSRHVHTLLMRGLHELQVTLPGLDDRLVAAGARRLDWTQQRLRSAFGWVPRFDSGLLGVFCTRDLLELEVRRRVAATPNVTLVEGTEAVGLRAAGGRVVGVMLRPKGHAQDRRADGTTALAADLVIDATGRSSRAPDWLGALDGRRRPPETVVTSSLGYASRLCRMPAGFAEDWALLAVRPPRPDTRGGVLYPVEGGRWAVTLTGVGEQRPPHDEAGFLAFARDLPGDFGEALAASEPLTRIATYRRTDNRWRRWDRVRPWPDGLLVAGDALCCFNPVYGQGMSVALVQAAILRAALTGGWSAASGGGGRLQRALADAVRDPWALSTGEDFRNPDTVGERSAPTRAGHWYADRVVAATVGDPVVYRRFLEVTHLLRSRRGLLTPAIVRRVAGRGAS